MPKVSYNSELLTVPQIAKKLQVKSVAIHRKIKSGEIKGGKVGSHFLVSVENFNDYLNKTLSGQGEKDCTHK